MIGPSPGITLHGQCVIGTSYRPVPDRSGTNRLSWRPPSPPRRGPDYRAFSAVAFDEDRRMIEAQQRVIDRSPNPQVIPSAHDRGVTLFNRLVEKLARKDGDARAAA